jgi:hypothetical protein
VDDLVAALDRVIADVRLRRQMIDRGRPIAAAHTLERTGELTRAVYERAAAQ